ncbi:unnamed protein product [Gongylonema pulchrum]|uniref:WH2 domain-containing protein n=1 Tax=Gongylonema pulchrum TaxID=637853 RepID=A0A183CYE1_9BILA|nr:unnamed protein product [Gongylonema pulchrum]
MPPPYKAKPAVKGSSSATIQKVSIPEQFKTLRPSRPANETPTLRRSGSSDDVRNTTALSSDKQMTPPPLPLNPPSSSRIAKPACPPPPPPNQPSRIGRPVVPTTAPHMPTSTSTTSLPPVAQRLDEDSPPPPPPPRIASCADQMDRFTFIPLNELPPPGIFSGSKKIYEFHSPRRGASQSTAPASGHLFTQS